jgi:hypothetical protein
VACAAASVHSVTPTIRLPPNVLPFLESACRACVLVWNLTSSHKRQGTCKKVNHQQTQKRGILVLNVHPIALPKRRLMTYNLTDLLEKLEHMRSL